MDRAEALEKLLNAHVRYYNVNDVTAPDPFVAEATFQMHDERYMLIKSAKISETDSGEIVFFASTPYLTQEELTKLAEQAWEIGLTRIEPGPNHKNTDVILYILADQIELDVKANIRKTKFYKGYRFGLHGYSHFKLVAHDLSDGTTAFNRMGEDRKKVIENTFKEGIN